MNKVSDLDDHSPHTYPRFIIRDMQRRLEDTRLGPLVGIVVRLIILEDVLWEIIILGIFRV